MKKIIISFLLSCFFTLSMTAQIKVTNQFHFVDNSNNLHVVFDVEGLSKNDFISFEFSYEYYDYSSSRFITLKPLGGSITGANNGRNVFISTSGNLKSRSVTWHTNNDENVNLENGLPAGDIFIDVYRYTRENSGKTWRLLSREEKLRNKYENQLKKGHTKRACRLKVRMNKVINRRTAQK